MTEETTEEVEEVKHPEYRESENRGGFLQGPVAGFREYGEEDGDYCVYGEYAVAIEVIDSLSEHRDEAVVQVHTVEYESTGNKCPDCGEEYDGLAQHLSMSDCEADE